MKKLKIKRKQRKGMATLRNSTGQAKRMIDPMPQNAATGDELLETFFNNLARMYYSLCDDQPEEVREYIFKQLERIITLDKETKKPASDEEQTKWRAVAFEGIKRRANEMTGLRDRVVLERWKGQL